MNSTYRITIWFLVLVLGARETLPQGKITSPKEQFGFNIGDDYQLADYTRLVDYWHRLARESQRMKVVEIGKTAEGRSMLMAIITSPANQKEIGRYREISARLARGEAMSEEEAHALAREGRAVVWVDGGLHATEVLGAQHLIEVAYQLVSMSDAETLRLLNDDIVLLACPNPDGMELVSDWYMREPDPAKRSMRDIPRLYHKYIGHDNNRDFYIANQPETEAINHVFYRDWYPQIIYNHHQSGPPGTVLFAPPFRDPFNYYFDPLVPMGIDLVAAAMHNRFIAEGKRGATMRSGAPYSTWWNGGLRTTAYFHNMIGLLTESIGSPTPIEIPFVLRNQLPRADLPAPIAPQKWHFRQSIDYSVTADRAVFDVASKFREEFLFNIYRMARNSIERGSRDNWTTHPKMIEAVNASLAKAVVSGVEEQDHRPEGRQEIAAEFYELLKAPADRDPRGYILPSDQPDFPTAVKFANALFKAGIDIHRATGAFQVGGKAYPAGSLVVKTAQAFRPHVLDMFEPQDHPDDIEYPGGPPRPPYDSAGWTLAYQMGVKFDRVLEGFEGPFEKLDAAVRPPSGHVDNENASGYLLSHGVNDAFIAINRLLASGEDVFWRKQASTAKGKYYPAGTIYIPARPSTLPRLRKLAADLGLNFDGVAEKPAGEALRLRPPRIGLWDRYGGSTSSGWTRWLLEQFEFPFELVYPPTLDAGNLAGKYDVLIFVTGGIPPADRVGRRGEGFPGNNPDVARLPEQYRGQVGNVTIERTIPQLRRFLEEGGTVLAIGSSTSLGTFMGLPLSNHLVERLAGGMERPLPREKFFVPGSLIRGHVDTTSPLAYGLAENVDFFFDNSPVLRLRPEAALAKVRPVAWFDGKETLRSGWALGQGYLDQGVAVIDATVGKGKLFLFGPEIVFRAQPHGTFKFLFNGIYYGGAESTRLP